MVVGLVNPSRDVTQSSTRRVDDDDGKPAALGEFGTRPVCEEGDGAALAGRFGKRAAVTHRARQADKEVTGLYLVGAERDPGDFDTVEGADAVEPELADQAGE